MTTSEFSAEFDILYNNISSNQAPGLTEYEKSVFLTKAQDEIIKNHFTNKPGGNKYQEGIEDSSKRFADFSCLITVASSLWTKVPEDQKVIRLFGNTDEGKKTIDNRGVIFQLPLNLMITLNERCFVFNNSKNADDEYQVVPITLSEYQRLMSKPSSDPLKRQVWKLMGNSSSGNGSVEIVLHHRDDNGKVNLTIRYVRHPYPIILEDLSSQGLSINAKQLPYGLTAADSSQHTDECCELSKELHPEILQRAVELAKIYYQGAPADVMTAGQRSE